MFNVFPSTLMDVILMIAGHGEEEGWECGGSLSLREERVSECCKQDHIKNDHDGSGAPCQGCTYWRSFWTPCLHGALLCLESLPGSMDTAYCRIDNQAFSVTYRMRRPMLSHRDAGPQGQIITSF